MFDFDNKEYEASEIAERVQNYSFTKIIRDNK